MMNLKEYISAVLEAASPEIERINFEVKVKPVRDPKTKDVTIRVVMGSEYIQTGILRFTVNRKKGEAWKA